MPLYFCREDQVPVSCRLTGIPCGTGNVPGSAYLTQACRERLAQAAADGEASAAICFPAEGMAGIPLMIALNAASRAVRSFLAEREMDVYLVLPDREALRRALRLLPPMRGLVDAAPRCTAPRRDAPMPPVEYLRASAAPACRMEEAQPYGAPAMPNVEEAAALPEELAQRLRDLDAGFSETLLRLIDEKGMTDPECYRRANIDRKLFSKIRSTPDYHPKKPTAVAFAVALGLTLEETRAFIAKAGYALSPASRFDVIVEYFISAGNADLDEINQVLFACDLPLLGG